MESQIFKQIAYALNKSKHFIFHICTKTNEINRFRAGSKLQKLFLKWLDLNNTEKEILNNLVTSIIPDNRNCYFMSIMKGFQLWNDLQDKEGEHF